MCVWIPLQPCIHIHTLTGGPWELCLACQSNQGWTRFVNKVHFDAMCLFTLATVVAGLGRPQEEPARLCDVTHRRGSPTRESHMMPRSAPISASFSYNYISIANMLLLLLLFRYQLQLTFNMFSLTI